MHDSLHAACPRLDIASTRWDTRCGWAREGMSKAEPSEVAPKPYNNQHKLPRLPIPTLDETCDRYLKCTPCLERPRAGRRPLA
jgi:hypothetical protein